uniref:NADH dehydrogenase subunit 4L n=1 Tax=Hoplopleura akanezumi TaxID=1511645 RepID=A0A075ECN8_9NEOP|nr:NADH dehydrogenase subunit 4L [Hoplopleura akanezumi]
MLMSVSVLMAVSLFKVLSSNKMTISLVALEFVGATVLVGLLMMHTSSPVIICMMLISMFVCESVVGLTLLCTPLIQGGPSPRELSVLLF